MWSMGLERLNKKGQMKIQQMAFMIVAVFIFFILAGIFLLRISFAGLYEDVDRLEREQAIKSLEVIADMQELNCGSSEYFCLDEDKLRIMSEGFSMEYEDFWSVASIEVRKIYNTTREDIECPDINCNYYNLYDSGQRNKETESTFVSICKRVRSGDLRYNQCEIGKLTVGRFING